MTTPPKVSFLIPAQNRPLELKAALASCIAQSLDAWEAVVVDDHSEVCAVAVVIHDDGFPGLDALRDATGERGL